jgi:hypothetical protein
MNDGGCGGQMGGDEEIERKRHGEGSFIVEEFVEFGGDGLELFESILGGEGVEKLSDLFNGDLRILDHGMKRHRKNLCIVGVKKSQRRPKERRES